MGTVKVFEFPVKLLQENTAGAVLTQTQNRNFLLNIQLFTRVICFACLVKELPQGLVALPLVADFGGGNATSAGADVCRAVLLARVVQVAGLSSVQTVILSGHCGLT